MERMERINELMKREISDMLQKEFQDPRFLRVTVTGVSVSRDLRYAKVLYTVLGEGNETEQIQENLSRVSGFVRKLVGERIRLRHIPEIQFVYDKSVDYSIHIEQMINEIHQQGNGSEKL
ncbi:MAG: 30S ribosome-binding factor RbfA [Candidatus Omnitrophota bacterium]|nr:30S ribosome-binding factor RbfA [Candidatus Omnitrophota bacterium]MDZ4242094.1 30S ribosome-binding factor RbfA [Candidatus Omnitrophota bacterium]